MCNQEMGQCENWILYNNSQSKVLKTIKKMGFIKRLPKKEGWDEFSLY